MPTYIKIKIRRDSTANWASANPILDLGEIGADMDKHGLKVGNGVSRWTDLPFCSPELVNDLITGGTDKALTAEQGKELNKKINDKATELNNNFTTLLTNLETKLTKIIDTNAVVVEDNLNSSSPVNALSAKQGKELKALIDRVANGGVTVEDNLYTKSSSSALSANMGVELKGLIDGVDSKVTNIYEQVSGLGIFGMSYTLEYRSDRVKPQRIIFSDGVTATLTWLGDSVLQKITASTGEVMTINYDDDGRIVGRTITRP